MNIIIKGEERRGEEGCCLPASIAWTLIMDGKCCWEATSRSNAKRRWMVKVNLLILGLKGCVLQMNGEALCDSGLDEYGVFLSTEFSVIINKLE